MQPMGLEPTTLPSIALTWEEEMPFEPELIGTTPDKKLEDCHILNVKDALGSKNSEKTKPTSRA